MNSINSLQQQQSSVRFAQLQLYDLNSDICHSAVVEVAQKCFGHFDQGTALHAFHGDCLLAWFNKMTTGFKKAADCPSCRKEVENPDLLLLIDPSHYNKIPNWQVIRKDS